jgi:hypothetical protein
LALAIKALDATVSGTPLCRLSWIEPSVPEAFPRLNLYGGLTKPAPVATFEASTRFASNENSAKDGLGDDTRGDNNLGAFAVSGDGTRHRRDIDFAIEVIDPVRARQFLAHNTGNRRISRAHVEVIARYLSQGRWMFNAQPICFTHGGRLLSGQHRLQAVILAGREIEVPVVRNLDQAAFATYDSHAKRRADRATA